MKRTTVTFELAVYRALRRKCRATDQTISDIVNEALRESLAEDDDDLTMIEARRGEPARLFETFVAELDCK